MHEKSDIHQLSDIELLELLCSEEDDELIYAQFVSRFLLTVKAECLKICKVRKLDMHIGIQIAHETFERCRKYKSFKKDQINLPNEGKGVLVYLIRISTRLFYDYHKKQKCQDINHRTYFDDIFDNSSSKIDVKQLKKKKDLALLIFRKLNKKEQIVVLKDIEFKKHHKYLPDDVNSLLAEQLNVKKATIRKIRERAIEKIQKAIDEINRQ